MVTNRFRRISLILIPLFFASPALADEPGAASEQPGKRAATQAELDKAQRHYKRGVELFNNAVYDAALIEFRRAYEIAPNYKIMYNIGQVSRQLDDFASAVDAYKRYLREGGANVPQARETEVKAELDKIGQWVGKLSVTSDMPNAEITVDDMMIGRAPIASALINAGRRKITATSPGNTPLTRIVDVAGGETAELSFDFLDKKQNTASAAPVEPTPPRRQLADTNTSHTDKTAPTTSAHESHTPATGKKVPWLWWGGATAFAAGAVGTGLLALGASNDLETLKKSPDTTTTEYDDTHSRMFRFALASDVLTGLAVATGGVALYLTLSSPSDAPRTGFTFTPTGVRVFRSF